MGSYKVVEDVMPNASRVLEDCIALADGLLCASDALKPYNVLESNGTSLAQYIAKTATVLKGANLGSFEINYPSLSLMLANGQSSDDAMVRLHDGIYKLGRLNSLLKQQKYVVKFDEDREKLQILAKEAAGDIIIFIIVQYNLYTAMDSDECYLSVNNYCERSGLTPSTFYGEMLLRLEATGQTPYGYEVLSKWRSALLDIDAAFLTECEDSGFPLDDEMSSDIVSGKVTIPEARNKLAQFIQQQESKEVKGITPMNMLKRLELS